MTQVRDKANPQRGCVGDMPIVWVIPFTHEVPIRRDVGYGDTEFSHMETRPGEFHILAPTAALALAHYEHERPAHVYTRTGEPEICLYLNHIIEARYVRLT